MPASSGTTPGARSPGSGRCSRIRSPTANTCSRARAAVPRREPATGHGFGTRFSVPRYADGSGITHVVSPYAGIMRVYQKYVFLPGTILGVLLAIGLGGMVVAWRRLGGEILLPWAVAVAMIVLPAATAEFDYRYLLPAVPFACLATAMVFGAGNPVGDRLAARRARRTTPAGVQAEVREPAPRRARCSRADPRTWGRMARQRKRTRRSLYRPMRPRPGWRGRTPHRRAPHRRVLSVRQGAAGRPATRRPATRRHETGRCPAGQPAAWSVTGPEAAGADLAHRAAAAAHRVALASRPGRGHRPGT